MSVVGTLVKAQCFHHKCEQKYLLITPSFLLTCHSRFQVLCSPNKYFQASNILVAAAGQETQRVKLSFIKEINTKST